MKCHSSSGSEAARRLVAELETDRTGISRGRLGGASSQAQTDYLDRGATNSDGNWPESELLDGLRLE